MGHIMLVPSVLSFPISLSSAHSHWLSTYCILWYWAHQGERDSVQMVHRSALTFSPVRGYHCLSPSGDRVKAGAANPGVLGAKLPPGRLSPWKLPGHRHDSQCQGPVSQREEDNRVLPAPGPDAWVGPEAINHTAFQTAMFWVLVPKPTLGLALLR